MPASQHSPAVHSGVHLNERKTYSPAKINTLKNKNWNAKKPTYNRAPFWLTALKNPAVWLEMSIEELHAKLFPKGKRI